MKVKSESEVTESSPTLSDPMDCGPPGSSVHGIFQARVLEWSAIAFSSLPPLQVVNAPKPENFSIPLICFSSDEESIHKAVGSVFNSASLCMCVLLFLINLFG